MNAASYSVRPGDVVGFTLGGRAVLLSSVIGLSWLALVASASADEAAKEENVAAAAESREVPATVVEPTTEEPAPTPAVAIEEQVEEPAFRRIGPVTTITEVSSGLPFPARVDTGATTCSIHYEEMQIEDAAENPADNVGKRIRVLIKNTDGKEEWITTKIVEHVTVRTSTDDEQRYKVPLKLRWQDVEKQVLVTLKDREKMKYPLLLGRNFLRGDFVVDVNLGGE
jgi:hypothetical protein